MSNQFKKCLACGTVEKQEVERCSNCYWDMFKDTEVEVNEDGTFAIEESISKKSQSVRCFTTDAPAMGSIQSEHGLVFGTSSKQAFWGLSTQADRLTRAYDAALSSLRYEAATLGANAVIGIRFALNNSTGSGATSFVGSSEAVMLLGTAVVIVEEAKK